MSQDLLFKNGTDSRLELKNMPIMSGTKNYFETKKLLSYEPWHEANSTHTSSIKHDAENSGLLFIYDRI